MLRTGFIVILYFILTTTKLTGRSGKQSVFGPLYTYVFSRIFAEISLDVHSSDSNAHVSVDKIDARSPTRYSLIGSQKSLQRVSQL